MNIPIRFRYRLIHTVLPIPNNPGRWSWNNIVCLEPSVIKCFHNTSRFSSKAEPGEQEIHTELFRFSKNSTFRVSHMLQLFSCLCFPITLVWSVTLPSCSSICFVCSAFCPLMCFSLTCVCLLFAAIGLSLLLTTHTTALTTARLLIDRVWSFHIYSCRSLIIILLFMPLVDHEKSRTSHPSSESLPQPGQRWRWRQQT